MTLGNHFELSASNIPHNPAPQLDNKKGETTRHGLGVTHTPCNYFSQRKRIGQAPWAALPGIRGSWILDGARDRA
ncbi:hypothetical protein VTI28DRAFT_2929 [Corynascus sepedonium]